MGQIIQSVTLQKAGLVCVGQTLQLIGPIHQLQRKCSVLNMTPITVIRTLHLLCNLQMGQIFQSVTLQKARMVCVGQTLQLIGPIHELQRKCSILNMTPSTVIRTLHFLCTLEMGQIIQSFTLQKAIKVCQGQTLQLIGSIHKLQRKWRVAPGTVFTTLHFLCNLQMGQTVQSVTLQKAAKFGKFKHSSLLGLFISCEENAVL